MTATADEPSGSYHHGNLREALLDAVGAIVAEKGLGAVSLREAARRAGVSHGAPAHHFGDKLGMLTAYSTRGFQLVGDRMRAAAAGAESPGDKISAIGLEYLRFAVEEQAYFEVMFRGDMHNRENEEFLTASTDTFSVLTTIAGELTTAGEEASGGEVINDPLTVAIRAWSLVHGLATLWLDGALSHYWEGDNIYELALRIFEEDFPGPLGVRAD